MIFYLSVLALIVSYIATLLVREIAMKKQIMDIPNARSSHSQPTPRGGGIAIIIAWYSGLIVLKFNGSISEDLFLALISGFVLAFVSFIDDIFNLKPWIRILFQLLTVFLGLYFIGGLKILYLNNSAFAFPFILNILVIIGAIWFINLYNFLDGIDGYASIEAICIASGMYMIVNNPVLLLIIFSVLGFLIWNWPKARIFMGDIGSTQLGYILIILAIYFNNFMEFDFAGFLILSSLFWFDATLTLYRRWRNNEKLSQAHRKHAYQRIVQSGFSHRKTIIISIFINTIFIVLTLLSERFKVSYIITLLLCLTINVLLMKMIDNRFPFATSGSESKEN